MPFLRRRWRSALIGGLALLLLAWTASRVVNGPASVPTHDSVPRDLAVRFYQAQGGRDVDAFVSLWDAAAPTLSAQRMRLQTRLAFYNPIEVRDVEIVGVQPTDVGMALDVRVEMHAREPKTGELAAGFGRLRRVVECVRRDGVWKIWREYAIEDRIAEAFVRAESDDARAAVVATMADASRLELFSALIGRADERRLGGDAARALEILRLASALAAQMGDGVQSTRMLASLGRHHDRTNDLGVALEYYAKALPALPARGAASDVDERAGALSVVGSIHARRGDARLALEALRESLALREAIGHQAASGATLRNIGNVHLAQGDYESAAAHYRQALASAEALGDRALTGGALLNLGAVEHERGRYQAALTYYGRIVALGDMGETRPVFAMALNNIGLIHRLQGRHDLARDYLTRSLHRSEAGGDKDLLGSALLNLGMVERLQGNAAKALEYYQRSLTLREAAGQKSGIALALNSIGLLHHAEGRHDLGLEYFRRSLAISEQLGSSARIAQTLANLSAAHAAQADHARALAAARRAVSVARAIGHEGEVLWSALAAMGRAFSGLRQPARARQAFEEAIAALEHMRSEAGGTLQEQQAFLESRLVAHEGLTELLVSQGDLHGALAAAERAKARVLLDVLQRGPGTVTKAMTADERLREDTLRSRLSTLNADLRRERGRTAADPARLDSLTTEVQNARLEYAAFHSALYAAHPELKVRRAQVAVFDAREAHTVLPDARTAALEFVVLNDYTLLFVLTRAPDRSAVADAAGSSATLRVHRIPVKRSELTALVSDFRTRMFTRDLGVREPATRLFQLLLAPAREALSGASALVVVPDGILWEVPFQALQSAPDRYVIEDHAVSYAASLTVLREIRRAARAGDRAAPLTLLAFGNPALGASPRAPSPNAPISGVLGPLPDAERQVHLLGQLYGPKRSRVYIGDAAREQRAKAEAGTSRILHLATHGVLDDESPMHSYLLLSQAPPQGDDDGLLEAWEVMNLDLDADLVVLSACETGRGRVGPGEGVIGMSWAAFVAGSPATVASLWKVQSHSTTELMVEFHRALLAVPDRDTAPSKAEALQRAAVRLLRDGRYRHPFYWAGFVLIGDTAPLHPASKFLAERR